MNYCSKCLYPTSHPLNIILDKKNICSGCIIHEEKNTLDWNKRFDKLNKIIKSYKTKKKDMFDCIVPVSGGRDSHFILHIVKKILKLNPLIVDYNTHYNTEAGIRNLNYLKSIMGTTHFNLTTDPKKVKKITHTTLKKFGNIYWHCIAGQTVFPVQIACKMNIPLIIWGAHQGIDQVGMYSHLDEIEMTRKYRKEHDLFGYEAEDLLETTNLKKNDLENYMYPSDKEIFSKGIKGIYLNNYIRWDSKHQHELMISKYKYETVKQERTFDTYNHINCLHYSNLHDFFKYLKFGYSLINDHCSREIRLKRITRDQGIYLVNKYRNKEPNNINYFLNWMGIKQKELKYLFDKFRDTSIWVKTKNKWVLKNDLKIKLDSSNKINIFQKNNFISSSRKSNKEFIKGPILFGKGYDI